ncbi:hypothetical protein UABAM_01259 [Candidatus Uabimicrobium amorphum]|uniref:O-antigen ligase-related domain-containing protein n=2 Tax=Uabimicrobium amorphum TaxID=2596890 RepID=A0A5S9IK41_UABAM|nr:hypothetical protein UABAM_01259 [Candidatus Uabimicrobium amorphum]
MATPAVVSKLLLFVISCALFTASCLYGAVDPIPQVTLLIVVFACWFCVLIVNTKNHIVQIPSSVLFLAGCVSVFMVVQWFLLHEQVLKAPYTLRNISLPWETLQATTTNLYEAKIAIYKWLLPILVLFLVPQIASTSKNARYLLGAIIVVGLFQACLGLAQFLVKDPIVTYLPIIRGEVHGTFVCRNTFAGFLAVIGILSLSWFVKFVAHSLKKSTKKNMLVCVWQSRNFSKIAILFICTLIIVLCIFLSVSRGAILSFFCGSVCFLLLYVYRHNVTFKQMIVHSKKIVPLVAIFLLYLYLSTLNNIYERFALAVEKGDIRSELWDISMQVASDYPLGVGGRNYFYATPAYNKSHLDHFVYPHNDYVQWAMEYGVVGVVLLSLLLLVWLRYTWKIREDCVLSRTLWAGCLAGCVVLFCHGFVDYGLQIDSHRLLLALLMGLLITRKKVIVEPAKKSSYIWLVLFTVAASPIAYESFCRGYSSHLQPKKIFDTFYKNRKLGVVEQRNKILNTVDVLKESLAWNQRDPELLYKIGFFYREAARLHFAKKDELLKSAAFFLEKSREIMPNNHAVYVRLAEVYFAQKDYKKADQYMTTGVTLGPYKSKYAAIIAKYWLKRWEQTQRKVYLDLIADRLWVMSKRDCAPLPDIFKAWRSISSHYEKEERWYGVVFPKENDFVLEAGKYFLQNNELDMARRMARHIKGDNSKKNFLLGHIHVHDGSIDKALENYARVDIDATLLREIVNTLVAKKYWDEAVDVAKSNNYDLPLSLEMVEKAVEINISMSKVETFLIECEKNFAANATIFYLRALIAEKKLQLEDHILYAEKAVEQDRQNFRYLIYLLQSLLKRNMWNDVEIRVRKYSPFMEKPFKLYKWVAYAFYNHKLYNKSLLWAKKAQQRNNGDFEINSLVTHLESKKEE